MKGPTTVAGKGKISEPSTAGTSNLDWRYFEANKIDTADKNNVIVQPRDSFAFTVLSKYL